VVKYRLKTTEQAVEKEEEMVAVVMVQYSHLASLSNYHLSD
jgi:hypothetical protein